MVSVPGKRTRPPYPEEFRREAVELVRVSGLSTPDVEDVRFKPAARRAIRKAERSGLVVERDSSTRLIAPFYDICLEWTRQRAEKSGVPRRAAGWRARRREPLRKLEAVAGMHGDACRVWLARAADRPVAAIITLVYGDHAVYGQDFSETASAEPLRGNNLLHRLAIEDACESGCRWYSLGESGAYCPSFGSRRAWERPLVGPSTIASNDCP
jgi:Acetyltransferase (GNAT) domain